MRSCSLLKNTLAGFSVALRSERSCRLSFITVIDAVDEETRDDPGGLDDFSGSVKLAGRIRFFFAFSDSCPSEGRFEATELERHESTFALPGFEKVTGPDVALRV